MKLKSIFYYPVKSLKGISSTSVYCTKIGIEHDRRFMLVDDNNTFISQRKFPQLTQVSDIEIHQNGHIKFKINGLPLEVNKNHITNKEVSVKIWGQDVLAKEVSDPINQAFSDFLNTPTRLVYLGDLKAREKALVISPWKTNVSFADGYPYLITSQQSVDFLNHHLDKPVGIDRFRGNIHLDSENDVAFFEDDLNEFSLGTAKFKIIKPCARCTVINTDQKTGERLKEPLKTLSLLRKKGNKIYFGANAICTQEGSITLEDKIIRNE